MAEFQIIEKYFKKLTNNCSAAQGLNDDVAKFSLSQDEELVISKDAFCQDVHFLLEDGGFKIASKLLRTNLSDLASAGATPLYYMLAFGKSKKIDEKFIKEFARGLFDVQKKFKISLIGGDTVSTNEAFFSITIFGKVKKGQNLKRNAAKSGDLIFVSGNIGDAQIGLETKLKGNLKKNKKFLEQHFFPNPQIKLGEILLKQKLSKCAIDISDGLLADLKHLCEASKLSAKIFLDQIPLSEKNLTQNRKLELLSGGDDYELIFAVDVKNEKKILQLAKKLNLKLTCIGSFIRSTKPDIVLLGSDNKKIILKKLGYEHF